jgi:ABC-type multidrug transport system ATPase subunit
MPLETPRGKAAFELREVSKLFGDLVALEKVWLRIEPGDSLLLYGPNGAGKTTLLRVLATLSRPSEGQVLFGGVERSPDRVKAAIGFASHTTFLYGELSAFENLKFVGRLFGLADLKRKVEAALDSFGLRERATVPVREQRVSLARAFLHQPEFLLLDEPFTGLDAEATEALEKLLRRLPDQGKTLVFSTHDFERGVALARRLVVLEQGRVRYDGPVSLAPLESLRVTQGSGQ